MDNLYQNLLNAIGDREAATLCMDYFIVAQAWDDLIDRDKELNDKEINDAFHKALVSIPTNPFYLKYSYRLIPVLETSIYKWFKANEYENESKEFEKAYMLRAGLYDLFSMCVIITRGIHTNINIYDLYGELFKDYKKEFTCQIQ